jgi:TPR repeat protein
MKKCLAFIAAMLLFCNPVFSQSYDLLTRGETGDVSAQMMLGDMFAAGEGVPQSYVEAAKWYRLAAQRGIAKAQLSLGLLYSHGQGVKQSIEIAYQWVSMAAAQGAKDAIEARDLISGQLDVGTRDRAQQLATRCFESKYTQCE